VKDPLEEASDEVTPPRAAFIGLTILVVLVGLFVFRPGSRVPLLIIVGIIVVVMLHEAGHFYTARRAGMKVTEYFVGFGPRIWSFRRGETEYGVKAIPAGGYVRIIGMNNLEEVDPGDEDRTYRAKPFRSRFVVVIAGVTVNFVLAFVLFAVVLAAQGRAVGPSTTIAAVGDGTPAAAAGIERGDRVLSIGSTTIGAWDDVPDALVGRVEVPTPVVVERGGREVVLEATPVARDDEEQVGCLGISPRTEVESVSALEAGPTAASTMVEGARDTAVAIGRLVSPAGVSEYSRNFTEEDGSGGVCASGLPDRPVGIVGIVAIGSEIAGSDLWALLGLLAAINLILGLFNVVPLLPFDGGHAAVAIYETVNGKLTRRPDYRADYRKLIPVSATVLILLLALALSVTFLDVRDLFN